MNSMWKVVCMAPPCLCASLTLNSCTLSTASWNLSQGCSWQVFPTLPGQLNSAQNMLALAMCFEMPGSQAELQGLAAQMLNRSWGYMTVGNTKDREICAATGWWALIDKAQREDQANCQRKAAPDSSVKWKLCGRNVY